MGDPDLDAASAPLVVEEVESTRWQPALSGCEGLDTARLHLSRCQGEPALGALIDDDGEVVCVDSLTLLVSEGAHGIGVVAGDPSPQPNRPPPPEREPSSTIY